VLGVGSGYRGNKMGTERGREGRYTNSRDTGTNREYRGVRKGGGSGSDLSRERRVEVDNIRKDNFILGVNL